MDKVREIYIRQKKEVDELFTEIDDFMENIIHKKEDNGCQLLFSEMRDLYTKWQNYSSAQLALDIITDVEFDVEEEEN